MNDVFGLSSKEIAQILKILNQYPSVDKAIVFGSRAKGNYRNASDVDLVLKGNDLEHKTIISMSHELNETGTMPYHFDILNYHTITNKALREHIDRVGICIYSRKPDDCAGN